mgnify:FL=1
MTRGLMWLPLLAIFFGLAWAGWNEYRKLETYKVWAAKFDRAKYDIYAALGQQGSLLTWGLPTRDGMVNTTKLDLNNVENITLEVDGQPIDPWQLPVKGRFSIGFKLKTGAHEHIPFTNGDMAQQWFEFLVKEFSLRAAFQES